MLFAIADAMHEEYKAITDAGIILQLDDPDLPDGYHVHPEMSVAEYQKFAELRVEAINHVPPRHPGGAWCACTSAGAAPTTRTRRTSR